MKSKKLVFIKKKTLLLLGVLAILVLLAGCSAGTPNADRIKSDLNASDIVGSKEFFGKNDPQMVPVTKVSVVDKSVEDDECEIKCNVVLEDNNYRIDAQVTAYYSKFDEWSFERYEIGEFSIIPNSGVPNSLIKQRAEAMVMSSVGNIVENAYVTNIAHDFDKDAKSDYVTFDLSARGYITRMNVKVSARYSFDTYWRVEEFGGEVIDYEWLLNDLVGTTWSGSVGIGATRTIIFNSVDTANKTMNISYYSSQDDCSYEIAEHNDSKAIKVYLPNESFTDQMWILGNGSIRYGKPGGLGGMLGIRDDNKVNAEVIIDGVEDTSDQYDIQQPTTEETKNSPIVPVVLLIIAGIIVVIVVMKKLSKTPTSKLDVVSSIEEDTPDAFEVADSEFETTIIHKKDAKIKTDDDSKSRLKTTFKAASEESAVSSSEEKSGDWFKSAGDL